MATTGQPAAFTVAATDADNDLLLYTWDFGDGTSALGANATHTYAAAGLYTVSVTVTDGVAPVVSSLYLGVNDAGQGGSFTISKKLLKFNFKSGRDSLTLSGSLVLPPKFTSGGTKVKVLIGSFTCDDALNAKGRGYRKYFKLAVRYSPSGFQFTVRNVSLFAVLKDFGFANATTSQQVSVPVFIVIGNATYMGTASFSYSAKAGRNGTGK